MKKLLIAASLALAVGGCTPYGTVDWQAVGAVTLGVGAAALGAAEVFEAIYSPPAVVVVCRGYWRC